MSTTTTTTTTTTMSTTTKTTTKIKTKTSNSTKEKESIMKKEEVNISSGQIGERLIVRTTTFTGQRLQYTITRPLNNQNIGCYSFARRSREIQPMNFEYSKKPSDRLQSGTTSTLPSTSTINSKIITNSTNNIDKSPLPVFGKSRQQINKPVVFYEQSKSLPPLITNDKVRFRRRENINDKDELKFEMPSRCISTPQSLNRNIPSTYDSNQFTTVRSTSFIDDFDSALSSRSRTAVVGPNMAQQSREGSLYDYGITDEKGNVRAYYSSDITRAYTSPPTPISRYDCGDPPPYYSHRRNTQPEDGQSYPLCSTPLSRSPRCEFSQSFSTADSSMLSRNTTNRPRELRIAPTSSSLMLRTTDNTANNTPSKHTNNIYPTSFRVHGTSGNTTTANNIGVGASIAIDEMVPMNNSTSNSRKV
ncbi:hypothetical protein DINM_005700 [Dirofilaria immitis]|nr:hypothetical protein [Dirofilaria immitis]